MKFDRTSALCGAIASAFVVSIAFAFGPSVTTTDAQTSQPVPSPTRFGTGPLPTATPAAAMDANARAATVAGVVAVIYQLDSANLHDIDESVQAGTIPSSALATVRRARIAAQAIAWPDALHDGANDVIKALTLLEPALRDNQVEQAKGPSDAAHDAEHDLSNAAYTWLSANPAPASH